MNENWSAMVFDLNRREFMKKIGVWQDAGYFIIDSESSPLHLFIGHPLIADDSEIRIDLVKTGEDGLEFALHNPSENSKRINLKTCPGLIEIMESISENLELLAGEEKIVTLRYLKI